MTHTDYTKKILNIEDENILSLGFLLKNLIYLMNFLLI